MKKTNDFSLPKRLGAIVIFLGTLLLFVSLFSIWIQDGVRAVIAGASFWSNEQRDAIYALSTYTALGDQKYFDRYKNKLSIQQNDMKARIELMKDTPDFQLVDQFFLKGRNHPDDVRVMGYVFHWGRHIPQIKRCLETWKEGDSLFYRLNQLANTIVSAKNISPEQKQQWLNELEELNIKLADAEFRFTDMLGNTARQVKTILLFINIAGFLLVFSSLTVLFFNIKKTQLEIIKKTNSYNTLIDGLNEAAIVAITDTKGTIVYSNNKLSEISGYSQKELIGANHRILNSGFHSKEFFADMWNTIISGNVWRGEICNRRKNGELYWVDSMLMPLINDVGERQYMAVRIDITESKKNAEALIQTSKMATLGTMSGGMAHEINNPLAIIQGKIDKIKNEILKPSLNVESVLPEIDKISNNVERISSIIRSLIAFSNEPNGGCYAKTSSDIIIQNTLNLCQEKFKDNNIDLRIGKLPNVYIYCCETQIEQVLLHLLSNAFDAVKHLEQKWISIDVVINEYNTIQFVVTDSGSGIPESIIHKIMDPFFTTKAVGKGAGLGLSISYGIVEKHNGRLWVDAHSPNTRFVFELPIVITAPPDTINMLS